MSDLIKREDAIKVVDSYIGTDPIVEKLKEVPSAEPKQGEWVDTEERETLIGSIDGKTLRKYRLPKCSLCGKEFGTPAYKYRFCPNCGADMSDKGINVRSKDESRKLSNREWKEFLSKHFGISKTSAKEMLHGMMRWKKEDNFKRIFNPIKEQDDD